MVVKGVGPGFWGVDEEDVTGGERGLFVKKRGWCEDLGRGKIAAGVVVCEWCLDQDILQVSGSVLCSKDVINFFFLQVFIMGVNNKMPESKFK